VRGGHSVHSSSDSTWGSTGCASSGC
jgi:hypothetical protein